MGYDTELARITGGAVIPQMGKPRKIGPQRYRLQERAFRNFMAHAPPPPSGLVLVERRAIERIDLQRRDLSEGVTPPVRGRLTPCIDQHRRPRGSVVRLP
jgi:hypothetical protein